MKMLFERLVRIFHLVGQVLKLAQVAYPLSQCSVEAEWLRHGTAEDLEKVSPFNVLGTASIVAEVEVVKAIQTGVCLLDLEYILPVCLEVIPENPFSRLASGRTEEYVEYGAAPQAQQVKQVDLDLLRHED